MKFLIINGPNINMLGIREPDKYGHETYEELLEKIKSHCARRAITPEFYQSNHEGDLVDRIQQAYSDGTDAIVINPGAFRQISYIRAACCFTVTGHGTDGYTEAIDYLMKKKEKENEC